MISSITDNTKPVGYWWCPTCCCQVDPKNVTYIEEHYITGGGCGSYVEWRTGMETRARLEVAREDLLITTLHYHDMCINPTACEDQALGTAYHNWHLACMEYQAALDAETDA